MKLHATLSQLKNLSHRQVLGLGVFLAALLALLTVLLVSAGSSAAAVTTVVVAKQSFSLEVVARGTVKPAKVVAIKSLISSNQAQLIYLHEEGVPVNAGLVIARFDTKPFMDRLLAAEQEVADTRTLLLAAQKAIHLQEEEYAGRFDAAQRNLEIAKIKLQDLKEGAGKLKRQQLQQKLQQDKRACDLARSELEDFEFLLQKGHVSKRERDKVADRLRSLEESLTLAESGLVNFEQYELARSLREAELLVEGSRTEQDRLRRTAVIDHQRLEADQEKRRRDVTVAEQRLEKATQDVANCDVAAPIQGVLLHTTLPRPEGLRKIQIGDAIWFGQTFIEMPDTRELIIEMDVREIDVAKLKAAMSARIYMDALPSQPFGGTLVGVADMAREDPAAGSIRSFRARVKMTDASADLHIGMSANVSIAYHTVKDVLAIPVAAISYKQGAPMVEMDSGRLQKVALGAIGQEWAEVKEGLKLSDKIRIKRSL